MATKAKIKVSDLIDANGDKTTKGVLTNRLGMLEGKFITVGSCASVPAYSLKRLPADSRPAIAWPPYPEQRLNEPHNRSLTPEEFSQLLGPFPGRQASHLDRP